MTEAAGGPGSRAGGLLDSLKTLARSLLAVGQTRLEILGSELEEQRAILLREVLLAVIATFCLALGVVFTALFFVILFWDTHRLYAVGGFALLYLGLGIMAGAVLRRRLKARPRLFATTLAELSKDRDQLTPR